MPRRLSLSGRDRAPEDWSAAVKHALDALARDAAYPNEGDVRPGALAVRFADLGELLACLGRDCLDGVAETRWWWRTWLEGRHPSASLASAWLGAPAHVPAALDRMAGSGDAVRFARSLSITDSLAIREAVERTHGLHPIADIPDGVRRSSSVRPPAAGFGAAQPCVHETGGATGTDAEIREPAQPPVVIARRIPEALASDLSPVQRALLIVGLGLIRAPAEIHREATRAATSRWLESMAANAASVPDHHRNVTPPQVAARSTQRAANPKLAPDCKDRVVAKQELVLQQPPRRTAALNSDTAPVQYPRASIDINAVSEAIDRTPPTNRIRGQPVERIDPARLRDTNAATPDARRSMAPEVLRPTSADRSPPASCSQAVSTTHGGLFCLLNAAIVLDLYGDFTRPAEPGIGLSPWDFLALAGERLVGTSIRRDPVWPLLAELAGREPRMKPGAFFEPPRAWRIPIAWLAPFAGGRAAWRWSDEHGRLRVFHPAGFCVLDVARGRGPAEARVLRELAPLREGTSDPLVHAPGRFPAPAASPLDRWLDWVTPYLGRRIALALALGARAVRPAMRHLVCRPARVEVGAARVDIRSPLADLPIDVRLAGLDRDPGWIPAAGRFVAFRYD